MEHPAAAANPTLLNVKVCCQKCDMIFDGRKQPQGRRGRFKVNSRGLKLHFRTNTCDGPCRRYYTQQGLSTDDFTTSLCLYDVQAVDRKRPAESQLSRPSLPDTGFSVFSDDDLAYLSDDVDTSSPSPFPMPRAVLHSNQKFTSLPHPSSTSSSPRDPPVPCTKPSQALINHLKLDYFLFHQVLEPFIPSSLALKPPSYSVLAHLADPQCSVNYTSPNGDEEEEDLFEDTDLEEDLLDVEDEASVGSFQSLGDDSADVEVPLAGPHDIDFNDWMVAKRQAFALRESGMAPATAQLQAEVGLLKLLNRHKAPLTMFPAVQKWARESAALKHDFSRTIRPRASVISELEERFDMVSSRFLPTLVSYLPDERPTVVYVASFSAAVYSLLSDPELMKEENLSFPHPSNPYLSHPLTNLPGGARTRKVDMSELHHGSWHKATHAARCTGPIDVLAPIIGYMDGVATDAFGRLGLTPFNFTLGIFNAATRSRKEAWVTIYYHPDDAAEASLHKSPTTPFHKCQNLHRGLEAAFAELREITRKGGLRWDSLRYGGSIHNVVFKFSLAFVIGDTEMHDKLCGKTLNRSATAQCLCRHCDAPLEQSINPDHPRRLFKMATFERHNAADNEDYFKSISHHPRLVNAFHSIDMGENIHNIHLASPGEILHMHQKGMMMRFVEGLDHLIREKGKDSDDVARNIGSTIKRLNTLALHYGALLSRSSDRQFPRTKFKNSLFSGTKKAAHEQAGVLLDLLLAMVSDRGRQLLMYERTLDSRYIGDQIVMCEYCLGLQAWMKKTSFTREEVRRTPNAMAYIIRFQEQVSKRGGMGGVLVKNHLFFHLADYLKTWGPLRQMNSGPSESHHKTEVKAPSMNTQRRPATFIQQSSQRYSELRVIRKACQKFGISDQQIKDNKPPVVALSVPVTGAKYSIGLMDSIPSMRWDSRSHRHRASILPEVIEFVCDIVLPLMPAAVPGKETCVPCFTEHKRAHGRLGTVTWRAHPCYRSLETSPKDVWYDWAWFELEHEIRVPCQILCLMDLSTLPLTEPGFRVPGYRGFTLHAQTQYAVVRKFKAPPISLEYGMLVEWGELEDGFYIFPLHGIYDPCCVVPNIPMIPWAEARGTKKNLDRKEMERQNQVGAPLGGYFVVLNQEEWGDLFTDEVVLNDDVNDDIQAGAEE